MTTNTGPLRAVAYRGGPLGYLTPDEERRAAQLVGQLEAWQDHAAPLDLPSWSGRAAGLLAALIADTHAGGIPQ